MNLLQALASRRQTEKFSSDYLPEVNAFVDVGTGGSTEHLPIEGRERADFTVRRPVNAKVGTASVFNYTNRCGRFRFTAMCTAIERGLATYDIPKAITVIELFGNKRRNVRVKAMVPLQWRYAPSGEGYGEFMRGTSCDISGVGMSMIVARELKPGTQLEFKLDLADGDSPAVVIGTLARSCHQGGGKFLIGLAFKSLRPTEANRIAQFINVRQRSQRNRALAD